MRVFRVLCLLATCAGASCAGDGKLPDARVGDIVYLGLPEDAFEKATAENKLVFLWRVLGDLSGGC